MALNTHNTHEAPMVSSSDTLHQLTVTHLRYILLSTTNKMQHYTIFFITVNALHVLGGFSTHHQEHKNCTHSIWYVPSLLAAKLV